MPSTPYDAKGLLIEAIRDDNPVVFLEHKMLYALEGEVPEGEYNISFGQVDIKREGQDVTVVATANMVHTALSAAEKLAADGISVEVVDPRTLYPLGRGGHYRIRQEDPPAGDRARRSEIRRIRGRDCRPGG